MKKIQGLFKRDYNGTRLVYDEVVPGSEWVLNGEGIATEKIDGTACLARDGRLYKRYDCKRGRKPPKGFEPCEPERDPNTAHWPGWLLVDDGPEDKWHREGLVILRGKEHGLDNGTYELVGPKIQSNPYNLSYHELWGHSAANPKRQRNLTNFETIPAIRVHGFVNPKLRNPLAGFETVPPRTFQGIKEWVSNNEVEGIVWYHPDGRMVKIKRKDFGLQWPAR